MYENKGISLADRVFEQLEDDILSGKYKDGEKLTETKLSNQLQVSRTPIREAIKRLEQEHIVKVSGKGIIVTAVNDQDVNDIYEIRLRIEGLASRWAAQRITEEGLSDLKEALDLQEFYTQKHDADRLKKVDTQFHRTIYKHCGSEVLESMLIDFHKRIQQYRKASMQDNERAQEVSKEHALIYEAITKRDGELAEKLTATHIINARDSIKKKESV